MSLAALVEAATFQINADVRNRILILDVERLPGKTEQTWWDRGDLKNRYIHHETVTREPRTTIVCAKWYDQADVMRFAEWDKGGRGSFLKRVHRLMGEADIIIGHNLDGADVPWLKGDFYFPRIGHAHRPVLTPLLKHLTSLPAFPRNTLLNVNLPPGVRTATSSGLPRLFSPVKRVERSSGWTASTTGVPAWASSVATSWSLLGAAFLRGAAFFAAAFLAGAFLAGAAASVPASAGVSAAVLLVARRRTAFLAGPEEEGTAVSVAVTSLGGVSPVGSSSSTGAPVRVAA